MFVAVNELLRAVDWWRRAETCATMCLQPWRVEVDCAVSSASATARAAVAAAMGRAKAAAAAKATAGPRGAARLQGSAESARGRRLFLHGSAARLQEEGGVRERKKRCSTSQFIVHFTTSISNFLTHLLLLLRLIRSGHFI